jgi:hypothetical protein
VQARGHASPRCRGETLRRKIGLVRETAYWQAGGQIGPMQIGVKIA